MIASKTPRVAHAIRKIAGTLIALFVWDVAVTLFYFKVTPNVQPIELPFSLFGSALALFIGFAVNASYGRWWEARGLWGLMINASRNVARQALTFTDETVPGARQGLEREIVRSQIAYVNVLRTALRGEAVAKEVAVYLTPEKAAALTSQVNKQNAILTDIGWLANEALKAGMIDSFSRVRIDTTLVDIANAQGGMERIKNTPLPSQYRFFPAFFAQIFCLVLPFAVVQNLGIYTPVGSTFVGLMFLMAVQIGADLMDPFANDIYDVPMTSMCRTVEIDLLQMMGDPAPEKVQPVKGVLW
jgi:putative membrane protein